MQYEKHSKCAQVLAQVQTICNGPPVASLKVPPVATEEVAPRVPIQS